MKIKKTNYRIVAAAVLFLAATAVPARGAWERWIRPGSGTPGYVRGWDVPGAEGGICGDPPGWCISTNYDQMFVQRYLVYSTPAPVRQNIRSGSYLCYWNGSALVVYRTHDEGGFWNVAGSQSFVGLFGSPSPHYPHPPGGTPAFYNLPTAGGYPGYLWTVVVAVSWYNAATGAVIAQAWYGPHNNASDIGCATFATQQDRCHEPYLRGGLGYIWLK